MTIQTTSFMGLQLQNDPALVMTPLDYTKEFVNIILQNLTQSATLLDVGAGSGSIGLAVKSARTDAQVFGSDISPDAIACATENAASNGLPVSFTLSDLFASITQKADLIFANLPYVDNKKIASRNDGPANAIYASNGGTAVIENFLSQASNNLNAFGKVIFAHGSGKVPQYQALVQKYGFTLISTNQLATQADSVTLCSK